MFQTNGKNKGTFLTVQENQNKIKTQYFQLLELIILYMNKILILDSGASCHMAKEKIWRMCIFMDNLEISTK